VTYDVRFYGQAERVGNGTGRALWTGGQEVLAIAYDVMIPGYGTQTTNNLRLWESKPKRGFDLNSFNGALVLLCRAYILREVAVLHSWQL
jgi:glycogen phosphorylase